MSQSRITFTVEASCPGISLSNEIDRLRLTIQRIHAVSDLQNLIADAKSAKRSMRTDRSDLGMQNYVVLAQILAERRIGQILSANKLRGGDRKSGHQRQPRLKDMDISQTQSSRFQRLAKISLRKIKAYVEVVESSELRLTGAGLLRFSSVESAESDAKLTEELDSCVDQLSSLLLTDDNQSSTQQSPLASLLCHIRQIAVQLRK